MNWASETNSKTSYDAQYSSKYLVLLRIAYVTPAIEKSLFKKKKEVPIFKTQREENKIKKSKVI